MESLELLILGNSLNFCREMASMKQEDLKYCKEMLEAAKEVQEAHARRCEAGKRVFATVAEMEVQVAKRLKELVLTGMSAGLTAQQVNLQVQAYKDKVSIECPTFVDLSKNSLEYKKMLAIT